MGTMSPVADVQKLSHGKGADVNKAEISASTTATSARKLAGAVAASGSAAALKTVAGKLGSKLPGTGAAAGPELAVITTAEELGKYLLQYAADRGLNNTQRQFVLKPEAGGSGPIAQVCNYLGVVSGQIPITDIDTGKPVPAKYKISAFVSDLFKAAGLEVPPTLRLVRLDVKSIDFLGNKFALGEKSKESPENAVKKELDIAGYRLREGHREKDEGANQGLDPKAISVLAKTRIKLFATMARDLRDISLEVGKLGTPEARERATHLLKYAQEVLDQHFSGMKVEDLPKAGKSVKDMLSRADLEKFKTEIKAAELLPSTDCKVTPIKELMLGGSPEGRAEATKQFVYHLSNYYNMFPKGEVEVVNTYLKYMLHPDFASMKWNIVTLSAQAPNGDTRGIGGIHFQAPDPLVILRELEDTNPGLLKKRLGIDPKQLEGFLAGLKPEEQALIRSAWVEHFYRNPNESPIAGKQLISVALGIAEKHGSGVVSFEHEDVNKTSIALDVYSAAMVGLHPNERAAAYAISGGARIMVDPLTNKPILNVQPELVKNGEQNFELAWGFIHRGEGKAPDTLSIEAVRTFLLVRYGTIDAIDPRSDGTQQAPSAFAQMFNRIAELEKAGVKEIKFVPSRDVFFRDPKE